MANRHYSQTLTSSLVVWSKFTPSRFLYRLPGTCRNCTRISARLECRALPAFNRKGTPSHRALSMKQATAAKVGHRLHHSEAGSRAARQVVFSNMVHPDSQQTKSTLIHENAYRWWFQEQSTLSWVLCPLLSNKPRCLTAQFVEIQLSAKACKHNAAAIGLAEPAMLADGCYSRTAAAQGHTAPPAPPVWQLAPPDKSGSAFAAPCCQAVPGFCL